MRRAVLFLVLAFSVYAMGQTHGTASNAGTNATPPNASPGMSGQPAIGPAATAPTTNLGPSATQPLGTGQFTSGSTGNVSTGTTGGFVSGGAVYGGNYVPLLQTPEAAFSSGITTNLPNNPAGITNNPSAAAQSGSTPSAQAEGVFNTGAADFGMSSGTADNRSLGEVARDYRAQRGTQQARVYTNADIARLNQNPGVPLSSNLGPQGNAAANSQPAPPSSPTTPAVNANPAQPGQNQNLPAGEAQPK